jgi:hypothetical protein
MSPEEILQLQRSMGNQAVEQLLTGPHSASSDSLQRQAAPKTENRTGLPDDLKTGVELMSGVSLDDVRVHRNSAQPGQTMASAFTQGSDIHVAPGEESNLPHEAWHVVQQKQGRVRPSVRAGGVGANLESGLETEADRMGDRASVLSRLPSAAASGLSHQALGQPGRLPQSSPSGAGVRQFACGSKKKKKTSAKAPARDPIMDMEPVLERAKPKGKSAMGGSVASDIMQNFPVTAPHIVFRYDSRPIALALEEGYVATDPKNANITEGGENQDMVGGAHNFVGAPNYKGYSMINAHQLTKKQWREQGYKSFYWTAAVVRKGGMTYEWLLNKISDPEDRDRMRYLVMNRAEGSEESDRALKEIADRYPEIRGLNNVGTTEIVTDRIAPEDILGYFEIREGKEDNGPQPYVELKTPEAIKGAELIPETDIARYEAFKKTGGEMRLSKFV